MLFDFVCNVCKHTFEKLTKSSTTEVECPECGDTAQKQLSAPSGFQFKGSGFYHTDFKDKK